MFVCGRIWSPQYPPTNQLRNPGGLKADEGGHRRNHCRDVSKVVCNHRDGHTHGMCCWGQVAHRTWETHAILSEWIVDAALSCAVCTQMRRGPHWMDWKRSRLEAAGMFHKLAWLKYNTNPPWGLNGYQEERWGGHVPNCCQPTVP